MKSLVGGLKTGRTEEPKKKTAKTEPGEISDLETSLVEAIDNMLLKENGTQWKQSKSFAPSSSNQCLRYMGYRLRGYQQKSDFAAQTRRIFAVGNSVEDHVGNWFRELGILLDEQIEIEIDSPPIRGYIDFMIDWDGPKPVECKSIRDSGFVYRKLYHKPTDDHYRQLQCYLHATDSESGFLFYLNKNDSEILPILVKRNDEFLAKLFKKYDKIYEAHKNGILSIRPYKQTSANCKKCDAFDHCWADPEVGVKL